MTNQHTITANADDDGESRDPRLLTIAEAAVLLRSSVGTLRYWRWQGTGPSSFRLGRRVLYRHDDLIAWINDQHDHGPHAA